MASSAAPFVADPAALAQVLSMLTAALAPDSALQAQAYAALAENGRHPLFAEYLALVFVRGGAAAGSEFAAAAAHATRLIAGLTLKRAVETGCLAALAGAAQARLRGELLEGLMLEDDALRRAAANVLAAAVRTEGLVAAWPALPSSLCGALDSAAPAAQRGALEALDMLAEDSAREWCEEPDDGEEAGAGAGAGAGLAAAAAAAGGGGGGGSVGGAAGRGARRARPLDALLPRLFRWAQAPSDRARQLAASALFHFGKGGELGDAAVYTEYLRALAALTADPAPEMRRIVVRSLRVVVRHAWEVARPSTDAIVSFAAAAVVSDDEVVAKEACRFWTPWLESAIEADDAETQQRVHEGAREEDAWLGRNQGLLKPHLPALALALLSRLRMAAEDLEKIPASDLTDDVAAADRAEDVRPLFRARSDGGGGAAAGEEEEEEEDDEEGGGGGGGGGGDDPWAEVTTFTVRQAAAEALDKLTGSFNELVVNPLLPELQRLLQAGVADAALWKERDAAMLAIGCMSDGGLEALEPHLPMLIEYMKAFMRDPVPAVRCISAWALGRFAHWIVDQDMNASGDAAAGAGAGLYLPDLVPRLCEAMLSPSRRMQRASCSAIYSFAQASNINMARFAPLVLATTRRALPAFHVRSRLALYDMLGACAREGVFDEVLAESEAERGALLEQLVPRVVASPAFRDPPAADVELPALLEVLEAVTRPMGVGFREACPVLFERCMRLLETDVVLALAADDAKQRVPSTELGELSLCLIGGMFDAVRGAMGDLLSRPPGSGLVSLATRCCVSLPLDGHAQLHAEAFATLAEACAHAWDPQAMAPFAAPLMRAALDSLAAYVRSPQRGAQLRAANNGVWLLLKLAPRLGPQLAEAVTPFCEHFAALFSSAHVAPVLLENVAACAGALALHCDAARVVATVSVPFTAWGESWLHACTKCHDAEERSVALVGFCAAVAAAPMPAARFLPAIAANLARACDVATPPAGLPAAAASLLNSFKAANAQEWARLWDSWPRETQRCLVVRLGVSR